MARTSQAPKPRYDDLDVYGRRDLFIGWRDAANNPKKDLERPTRQQLVARDRLRDGLNYPAWMSPTNEEFCAEADADERLHDLDEDLLDDDEKEEEYPYDEDELDEDQPSLIDSYDAFIAGEETLYDEDGNLWIGDYDLDTDGHSAYGDYERQGAVFLLLPGHSFDEIFDDGHWGGNCGFSIKSRP